MHDRVLNAVLFLQTLFQPFVYLKYFTSFKVAFTVQIWKKILQFKHLFKKIEIKNGGFGENGEPEIKNGDSVKIMCS